jgi:DNA polymerase III delta prime subunit
MNNTLAEKYHPKTFDDIIGNKDTIETLRSLAKKPTGQILPILLTGPAGCGKTSAALAFVRERYEKIEGRPIPNAELKSYYIEFNASDFRGIDFIRDEIIVHTKYKMETLIYLNEADNLTTPAQEALRSPLEKKGNVIFILDGNKEAGFTDPIKSRCVHLRFKLLSDKEVVNRLFYIIKAEEIQVTHEVEKVVKEIAEESKGDLRRAINSLETLIRD